MELNKLKEGLYMKIELNSGMDLNAPVDIYIVPVFEGNLNPKFPTPDIKDFKGKNGEFFLTLNSPVPKRIGYLGLGNFNDAKPNSIRKAFGNAAKTIREKKYTTIACIFPEKLPISIESFIEVATEAIILGSYSFEELLIDTERKTPPLESVILYVNNQDIGSLQNSVKYGQIVAEATNFTRDLGNFPHNRMNAIELASRAEKMAQTYGLKVTIFGREEAERENMNLFLSVNNGSKNEVPGRFVVLEYNPDNVTKTLVLVGKGITFDTGGISLKPAENMGDMMYDMCGAAAVFGAMRTVAQLKPSGIRVLGLTPLTDNAPSSSATKPGDIVRSKNGKYVEIVNTDAEGRLVLADALTYAERYNPNYVIDMATLTGAAVVALGHVQAAVYFNEKVAENLRNKLFDASKYTGDLMWHMPLNKEYLELIQPTHADLKNSGGRPAGSITAAMFLSQFAEKYPWTHIDIAGTAYVGTGASGKPSGYNVNGATGYGVRLLADFIRKWVKE